MKKYFKKLPKNGLRKSSFGIKNKELKLEHFIFVKGVLQMKLKNHSYFD